MHPADFTLDCFEACDLSAAPVYEGVYIFATEDHDILYIGETNCARRRFSEHSKTKRWWKDVARAYFLEFESRSERLTVETVMILREKPRHNRTVRIGIDKKGRVYPLWLKGDRG